MKNKKNSLIAFIILVLNLISIPVSLAGYSFVPDHAGERRQFNFEMKPGESKIDNAVIANYNPKEIAISLYGADATHSNQGSFALTNKSTPQKAVGKWITFQDKIITIKPNERKVIPFTITIPEKTPPGNYAGGIAAEASAPTSDSKSGSGVIISSRLVLKVFVSVPGEKKVDFVWNEFSTTSTTDSDKFTFSYTNNGTVAISAEPWIQVEGSPANYNITLKIPSTIIMPGEKVQVPYELLWKSNKDSKSKPFFGIFKITASTIFSEYDIANNKYLNPQKIQKEIEIKIIPWFALSIIMLFLLLVITIFSLHHFRTIQILKKATPYITTENDTLTSIAEKNGVAWEDLAKINKLTAPYALQKGQRLLIPRKK